MFLSNYELYSDPPVVNRTVSSQSRVETSVGNTVKLVCFADGHPHPNYTWTIPSGLEVLSDVSGTLRVLPANGSYFGNYTCVASNSMGRDSHTIALVNIGKNKS